jgi:hypothetical protein
MMLQSMKRGKHDIRDDIVVIKATISCTAMTVVCIVNLHVIIDCLYVLSECQSVALSTKILFIVLSALLVVIGGATAIFVLTAVTGLYIMLRDTISKL